MGNSQAVRFESCVQRRPGASRLHGDEHIIGTDFDDAVHPPGIHQDAGGPLRNITKGVGQAATARYDSDPFAGDCPNGSRELRPRSGLNDDSRRGAGKE